MRTGRKSWGNLLWLSTNITAMTKASDVQNQWCQDLPPRTQGQGLTAAEPWACLETVAAICARLPRRHDLGTSASYRNNKTERTGAVLLPFSCARMVLLYFTQPLFPDVQKKKNPGLHWFFSERCFRGKGMFLRWNVSLKRKLKETIFWSNIITQNKSPSSHTGGLGACAIWIYFPQIQGHDFLPESN